MPRFQRCRRICDMPKHCFFQNAEATADTVNLTVDEYEAIRLIDYFKLTHAECAKRMNISRTTVTEIYEAARFKISQMLVEGKNISISGGNYHLCSGHSIEPCGNEHCINKERNILIKGEQTMRVAITYLNGEVFQHFGHTEYFKVYDIENNQIINSQILSSNGQGHGALAILLSQSNVDVLICGGIGGGAINALSNAGVDVYAGVSGKADEIIEQFVSGALKKNSSANCHHHDHNCGEEHDHNHHECHCSNHK